MSDLDEQLKRGELAERQVQAMLANECSLLLEIERLNANQNTLLDDVKKTRNALLASKAEIERLSALNAELLEMLKFAQMIIGHPDDSGSKQITDCIARAERKCGS